MRVLAALALVFVAILAGCGGGGDDGDSGGGGGDGNAAPRQWATDVCGSLSTWLEELQSRQTEVEADLEGVTDLGEIRGVLVEFLDDAVAETDTMIDGVEAAGTPDVDRGAELRQDFVDGVGQAKTAFEEAKTTAEDLPTDDQAAFAEGTSEIEEQLNTQSQAIEDAFDELDRKYDVPDLDEAFDEEPQCQDFN